MNFYFGLEGEMKIIPVFKETKSIEEIHKQYNYLKERELFEGKLGETYTNISYSGDHYMILGLGEEENLKVDSLKKAYFKVGKELIKSKVESIHIKAVPTKNFSYESSIQAIVEGLLQSEYAFEKYLSKKKTNPSLREVYLDVVEEEKKSIEKAIGETQNLIDCVFLARDLVNEPAMYMTPKALGQRAQKELENLGVEVKVYGKKEIEELGMKAFLAVSKGSAQEPQLIVMKYMGDPTSDKKTALVGKGLTYDSGGYSIKPTNSMMTMHSDMGGSASVIGAMKAIALGKLKKNVVAVVAACENMISGGAYKPGDIIGSMAGKTIEVVNTDAEGRITLADVLYYAVEKIKADQIIDTATLTGACVTALGSRNSGAITNNQLWMEEVKKASEKAGEPLWQLPTNEEYKDLIKGSYGDLKNSGGREAGTITAGLFLKEFVGETPWVHLDIAGTAYISKEMGYLPKGATGVPVKTLYYAIKG